MTADVAFGWQKSQSALLVPLALFVTDKSRFLMVVNEKVSVENRMDRRAEKAETLKGELENVNWSWRIKIFRLE